jgi:hypothetical protein
MNQPIINNNEVKKEESIRPSGSTESPKPAETPKKGFFSFFNPFSNNETEDQCIEKCRKKYQPKTSGGKKHRSKKNKNSKRKIIKSKSKKSRKSKK